MASSKKKTTAKKANIKKTNTYKKKSNNRRKANSQFDGRKEICLFAVLACAIVLFLTNIGFGGGAGTVVSNFFFGLFGIMAFIFPVILFVVPWFLFANRENSGRVFVLAVTGILFFLLLCTFTHLVSFGKANETPLYFWYAGMEEKAGGGIIGSLIGDALSRAIGLPGAFVVDIIAIIVCFAFFFQCSIIGKLQTGGQKMRQKAASENARRKEQAAKRREEELKHRQEEENKYKENEARRRKERKISGVSFDTKVDPDGQHRFINLSELDLKHQDKTGRADMAAERQEKPDAASLNEKSAECEPVMAPEEPKQVRKQKSMKISGASDMTELHAEPDAGEVYGEPDSSEIPGGMEQPDVSEPMDASAQTDEAPVPKKTSASDIAEVAHEAADGMQTMKKPYRFPPMSLLKAGSKRAAGDSRAHLQETAEKLEYTLKSFGVDAAVTEVTCGPTVTRYEIQPQVGVKVSKILNLTDDIKLNLAVADIRIEAPIPGKAAIGIEIPNKENVTVAFRDLIESSAFRKHKSKIAFAAGKDIGGETIVADIAKMPHLLIAGATGSGKSVCINTIIMSILYKAHPDDVKLIMIDPKVVELSVYNGIPHLMIPVVTDPKKAAGALHWAVAEMTERYQKFAQYHERNLEGYNKKVESIQDIDDPDKPEKMPQIVIIVDELADLMMVAPGDVEDAICRLAQLARAAGIHLIIATQRPSVNVITGLIKANMPSRIAFAVSSGVDSRTILDSNGAEKLLGKGDMLFYPQGYPKPVRVQGAFVSDAEVAKVVKYLADQNGTASYSSEMEEKVTTAMNTSNSLSGVTDANERDTYFVEAGKFLIEKEKGSIGSLQRMFKIGFNRAARIMDQLEEAGVVGPEEGTKPRRVLMTMEEFQTQVEELM